MRPIITVVVVILVVAVVGCNEKKAEPARETTKTPTSIPKVTDGRTDLVLSWYVDGGPEIGASVNDVPKDARKEVRVQDPTIPPEERDPDVVYLADLTKKNKDGSYLVKVVKRDDFEAERQAEREKNAKAKAAAMAALAGKDGPQTGASLVSPLLNLPRGAAAVPQVIMYATKHCPVCVKARRWLLEQKIPYIEKDLESDRVAAIELQKKGQAQGVSTNGVPIFEINGRLLPGFDPAQIVAMLVNKTAPQKTI